MSFSKFSIACSAILTIFSVRIVLRTVLIDVMIWLAGILFSANKVLLKEASQTQTSAL